MAPKKGQRGQKPAGGKDNATKTSGAPAKKPATKRAAAAPVETAPTRKQPGRRARGDGDGDAENQNEALAPPRAARKPAKKASAPTEDEDDDDDVVGPSVRKTRTGKRPAADATDDVDDLPPAKRTKRGQGQKASGPAEDDENEDVAPAAPPAKTRSRKRSTADDTDISDDVPLSKRPRRGQGAKIPVAPGPPAAVAALADDNDTQDQRDAELIDDVTNNPDITIALGNAIAQAELPGINFTLRDENADVTLRFHLEVHPDPWGVSSRLFYRLRFFITRPEEEEQEAGYIHAHRIAKRTAWHLNADNRTWINELLTPNLKHMDDGSVKENALCLRALFTQHGNLTANKVRDADVRTSLHDEALLFIEMIHIRLPFQRRGLLTPALENWQLLLQRLPEWCAFRGNVILVPGMPESDVGRRAWRGRDDGEVEGVLTGVYERFGFAVWVSEGKVGQQVIRVMGKGIGVGVDSGGRDGGGAGSE